MEPMYYLLYINLEFGDASDYSRHLYSDLNMAQINMDRQVLEAKRHFNGPGQIISDKPMCKAWAGDDGTSYAIGIHKLELEY